MATHYISCFNGATSARSWKCRRHARAKRFREASMGPRARARGNMFARFAGAPEDLLQWGHERALVEMAPPFRPIRGGGSLQWGHERALVEMCMPRLALCMAKSFNGATSAR